jgi:hypothetical protein
MRPIKNRAYLEIVVAALLILLFVSQTLVPAWSSLNTDFPNYYVAARVFSEGKSLVRVYDWIWFQRQKDHAGVENRIVAFSGLTLLSALPIVPLASMPPLQAKRWWIVINLLLLAIAVFLLHRMGTLSALRVTILSLLAIEPLHTQFLYGQLHLLVLVMIVVAFWLYLRNMSVAAGVTISVAAALKLYPILFVFYFLRKRQWRVLAGIAFGSVGLMALSIGLFGYEVHRVYLEQVLPRFVRGEGFDPYNSAWNSFTALMYRIFVFEPQLNPRPFVDMPAGYAVLEPLIRGLIFLAVLWLLASRRSAAEIEKVEYGTYVVALLLLSTQPASYHFTALIACGVLVTDQLVSAGRYKLGAVLIVLYVLVCLPTHRSGNTAGALATLLSSTRLIFTIALFVVLCAWLTSLSGVTWRQRLQSRSAPVFVLSFLALVVLSAFQNLRHLRSVRNYASRLDSLESLSSSEPAVGGKYIVFTKLQQPTYTLGILDGSTQSAVAAGLDLFHPALVPNSSKAFVEIAGRTSRIATVDLADGHRLADNIPIEIENGQQPSVSPDGRWLSFIREVRGRGSLWIKELRPPGDAPGLEMELVGCDYDVLEAAFAADGSALVFAAQPRGVPRLFTITRLGAHLTQDPAGDEARYPALSPDGRWLAYSRMMRGSWQIWIRSLSDSSLERQLTAAECNSISPAWAPDSSEIVHATDCGRGVGLYALARVQLARALDKQSAGDNVREDP